MAKRKGMPRGMYQRGAVYYSCIAGPERRMIRKRLSADYQTAKTILASMRRDMDLQRAGLIEPANFSSARVKTLEAVKEKYIHHMESGRNSETTIASFLNSWSQIVHKNKFVYLGDISLPKVEAWVKQRIDAGDIRGQTINVYVGHVYRALAWAKEAELIIINPLAKWSAIRINEARLRRDLTHEEINVLLETETDTEWRVRWFVYAYTGLRKSAGAAIRWEWIEWDRRLLHLPVEHNKSKKSLDLPIHDQFLATLRDWHQLNGSPASGLLFQQVAPASINKHLLATCRQCNIDTAGVTVHSFRHTFATMIYSATGKNLKAVQELLGHASASTSMLYLHVSTDEKKAAIGSLNYVTAK